MSQKTFIVRKPSVTPSGKIRKVQASKLKVSVIGNKILLRNTTLLTFLMIRRTIGYGRGKKNNSDDTKSENWFRGYSKCEVLVIP